MSLHAPFVQRSVDAALELEPSHPEDLRDEPLTLSRWIAGIALRWRLVLGVLLATLAIATLALVFVPPVYRAQSVFVANSSASSRTGGAAGALSSGGLAGVAASLGVGGTQDPSESPIFYSQLMTSRVLLSRLLLSRFPDPRTAAPQDSVRLLDLLRPKDDDQDLRLEKAQRIIRDNIGTRYDLKTNMVTVMVSTEWASLSAAVANRLTDLVNQFNLEQRQSRTRAKREFLDRRLVEARAALSEQEARIREFYEINRQFQGAPHLRLREAELRRQVDIAQDLFLTIQRERESAQLAEVNDAALITIVDNAIPPKRAEWPRPVLAIATATFVGLVLGFVAAGLGTVVGDWARREPGSASHLRTALGEAWGGLQRFPRRRRTG